MGRSLAAMRHQAAPASPSAATPSAPSRRAAGVDEHAVSEIARHGMPPAIEGRRGAPGSEPRILLSLQDRAGNRAVSAIVARALQRSEIPYTDRGETLYNQDPSFNASVTPGTAGAMHYGGGTRHFEMTRSDTEVVATVRILFVNQDRDTRQTLPDGTSNPNYLGHRGAETEIPASDERRGRASDIARHQTDRWNGRIRLRGVAHPRWYQIGGHDEDVDLPVRFVSQAVFGMGESHHTTVRLYPASVVASQAAGNPIDAGNYYLNTSRYGADAAAIYAHEYGHLLGLQDEYDQSNFQMHVLLHQVSPRLGGGRGAALDRATVERMVLAALTRPLFFRFAAAKEELSASFMAGRAPLEAGLGAALRAAAADPAVRTAATARLEAHAGSRLAGRLPGIVDFEAGENFSNLALARGAVATEFAPDALGDLVAGAYFQALLAPHDQPVDVGGGGSGRMSVNIHGSAGSGSGTGIWGAAGSGPLAGNASALAQQVVGDSSAGPVPPVRPSSSLVSQVAGIPATWRTAAGGLAAAITPAGLSAAMSAAITARGAVSGGDGPIGSVVEAYHRALALVGSSARAAARSEVRRFVGAQIAPALSANVSALQGQVSADVTQVMATPARTVAAAAPPDPDLRAVVTAMQARLASATPAGADATNRNAPAANPGSPANNPTGAAVPAQEVTYSNTGMMSDNSGEIRTDQFADFANLFNDPSNGLHRSNEGQFRAVVR